MDLNSVRQLAGVNGTITLARGYEAYGSPAAVAGTGASMYGFTGEQQDTTGLVFLRARYYAPAMGVFTQPDTPSGISRGLTQLGRYVDALQELTGQSWRGILDLYPK